ncbi:glycosyltransferase [Streptomyces mirabilis]|uniref:glycosyltransferase n=1 Tax=Streptomyces mirabilis TaxID=68239 RepID=UPI0036E59B97
MAYERFATTDPAALATWRARLGPYVLTVGGIEPRKGSLDLIEAYAPPRAVGLGIEAVVLGAVPESDLPSLVAAADVFAFPSLKEGFFLKEGFGLAAMEALAVGVPLVVRDLPVLREVFGPAARFADTPEALATAPAHALTSDDPVRAALGREPAARHTWTEAAARHLAFYRSVTGGSHRRVG